MRKTKNRQSLDDVLKEKMGKFESGIDRKQDEDLDDLIWDLGGYEDDAPLTERSEFERELPPIEEELTDELDETGERIQEDRSVAVEPDIFLLRIEVGGSEMEVVCGQIPDSLKRKLKKECEIEGVDPADIWYDDAKMKRIAINSWNGWYSVDDFYHEIGLIGKNLDAFSIGAFLDGEPIEDFDTDSVKIVQADTNPPPRVRKNFSAVVAGTLNEGRFIYEQDIEGEFDISKLEFVFTDLRPLGIEELMLTDVIYDGEPMYYEHEVIRVKDMLDVNILKT